MTTTECICGLPEYEESEDVAMGDEYLMRGMRDADVCWSVEIATKCRLQPRTIYVVRLHQYTSTTMSRYQRKTFTHSHLP